MEYYYQQDQNPAPKESTASGRMAVASLILGITAFASICCVIAPIPFGALSIILGLLSKGAEKELPANAKIGIAFSILGFILTIALIVFAGIWAIQNADSEMIKSIIEEYSID